MTVTDRTVMRGGRRGCRAVSVRMMLILVILTARCEKLRAADQELGLRVPDGFEITLYADDDLAHDVYSLTVDSLGRVVVSGAGYVKILIDADHDGVAESAKTYVDGPKTGAQGMYFFGRDLICAGDAGLLRYRDRNGDDRADGPPDVFLKIKAGNEHDLHAIRKGPDGWWYLIAGNAAGVNEHYAALPTSAVRKPAAGAILRLQPDLSKGEIYADGFRNAYDFDFSAAGELFAFDSDGEREVSLPSYLPTRVFHVLPGSNQGWITADWKRPDYFFDMPPVAASLGRGSPTGVICYQHTAFPKPYQGALFVMDWTFGRVWALPLQQSGSTWSTEPVEFITAVGQHGFAPTDIDVGPQGELYICVGGRGTRGGVYRVQAKNVRSNRDLAVPAGLEQQLDYCLKIPQPLCSWSRQLWEPLARDLKSEPFIKASLDRSRSDRERIRAIEILTEKFRGLDTDLALQLASDPSPLIRARAAWSLGRMQASAPNRRALEPFLLDADPLVARSALEAILAAEPSALDELVEPVGQQLAHPDRYVRQTGMRVLTRTSGPGFRRMAEIGFPRGWRAAIPVAAAFALRNEGYSSYTVDIALRILQGDYPLDLKLEAARALQLGLGDLAPPAGRVPPVFDGYAPRIDLSQHEQELDQLRIALAELYPLGAKELDRELERAIAMIQPPNTVLLEKVLAGITPASSPVDDIHRLLVAARIPAQPAPPERLVIADTLIHLETKIAAQGLRQDSNWDDRVMELYEALTDRDPRLALALLEHTDFGMPGHVQFITRLPPDRFDQALAAFVRQIEKNPQYQWNVDVVYLLGQSTKESDKNLIREKFDDFALRNAVITSLSAEPQEQDRLIFVAGLETAPVEAMLLCIQALQLLNPSGDAAENVALVRALRKLGDRGDERQARDQIVELLRRNLKERDGYVLGRDGDPQQAAVATWVAAVQARFPQEFARQSGEENDTLAELKSRLANVPWEQGDAGRGLHVFTVRGCVQCHGQRRALGPDLSGVAGRFSREDLFTAIVFPNRDVSPRYQTIQVATRSGQIRTGLVVYESVDGLVLRDANNHTYRIDAEEIELRRPLNQSLMPAGLLKGLSAADWADLYAYLRSLGLTSTAAVDKTSDAD